MLGETDATRGLLVRHVLSTSWRRNTWTSQKYREPDRKIRPTVEVPLAVGLSQAHFGKLFRTDANGKLHFTPRAVMNAGYTGIQQQIGKTDNAGHCSNWANWPNK